MNLNEKKLLTAIIGVSSREEKYGFKIFRDMLNAGYNVAGVNVRGGEVLGKKIYKNLKEIGDSVNLVITVVPSEITEHIVEECKMLGIKQIWMQPGSESEYAIAKAREYGISVTHNCCIMKNKGIW